jgi:hypothetical protein
MFALWTANAIRSNGITVLRAQPSASNGVSAKRERNALR